MEFTNVIHVIIKLKKLGFERMEINDECNLLNIIVTNLNGFWTKVREFALGIYFQYFSLFRIKRIK